MTEPYRWQRLADYNGRKGQGIVHTPKFEAEMLEEQKAFDAEQFREASRRIAAGPHGQPTPRLPAPNKPLPEQLKIAAVSGVVVLLILFSWLVIWPAFIRWAQ